jgi:hypothetical protein
MSNPFAFRWTLLDVIVASVVIYFLLRKRSSSAGAGVGTVLAPSSGDPGYFSPDNPTGFSPFNAP